MTGQLPPSRTITAPAQSYREGATLTYSPGSLSGHQRAALLLRGAIAQWTRLGQLRKIALELRSLSPPRELATCCAGSSFGQCHDVPQTRFAAFHDLLTAGMLYVLELYRTLSLEGFFIDDSNLISAAVLIGDCFDGQSPSPNMPATVASVRGDTSSMYSMPGLATNVIAYSLGGSSGRRQCGADRQKRPASWSPQSLGSRVPDHRL